jgi:hypothetical protein
MECFNRRPWTISVSNPRRCEVVHLQLHLTSYKHVTIDQPKPTLNLNNVTNQPLMSQPVDDEQGATDIQSW